MRYFSFIFILFLLVIISQAFYRKPVPPLPPPTNVVNVSSAGQLAVAISNAQSGQTILLADGNYSFRTTGFMTIRRSNVTVRGASGDPEKVWLSGWGFESSHDVDEEMIKIVADNVTIADLKIGESRCHTIKFEASVDNFLAHNVHFYNVGERCIKVPGFSGHQNVKVRHCIFENDKIPDANRPGQHSGGNYIAGMDIMEADGWHIHDNVFINIKGATGLARGAVFMWRGSRNSIIENNIFMGCDQSIALWEPNTNMTVRNNFIVPGARCGISCVQASGAKIYHNTSFSQYSINNGTFSFSSSTNCQVKNNIIQNGVSVVGGAAPDTSNNIILLRAQLRTAAAWFVNETEGNLHLASAVPEVVNKGISLGVTDDWDDDARTGLPDIGADEWDGSSNIRIISQESNPFILVSPNPFHKRVIIKALGYPPSAKSAMNVAIYDITGKLVWSHVARRTSQTWDGHSNRGQSVPPGRYIIRTTAGNNIYTQGITKVE
jgi:hypothetical protein